MIVKIINLNKEIVHGEGAPDYDAKWNAFVEFVFKVLNMPEVTEGELESGTYTNAQIAERLRFNPGKLLALVIQVYTMGSQAEKRSVLSFAVDML